MSTPNDSDLRRLLDDAVSDVHPDGGPEQIRSRARRPSAGRWVPLTLAAAAATILVIGGGTWLAQQSSNPPSAGPNTPQQSASNDPGAATRTVDATIYYVGATASGPKLFPEKQRLTGVTGTDLQAAVDALMSRRPSDPDYNQFPQLWESARATTGDGLITIDFLDQQGTVDMDPKTADMSLQAMVWTATEAVGQPLPVRFAVDGKQTSDPILGGSASGPPAQRASEDSALAPVLIDSPTQGATVPTQFEVTGQAATFEANVVWELKRGDETVRNGFTTAQECCTLSPYSFTVTAPPGDYTLVVHDTDESGGEGFGTSQDTKDITVE